MRYVFLIFLLILSSGAEACSVALGYEDFQPMPNIRAEISAPKKPEISGIKINRGKYDSTGASCVSVGSIVIQFSGVNPIEKTGYKFSLIEGGLKHFILPKKVIMPIRNKYVHNAIIFHFSDGYKFHKPIELKIELIAVSPEGNESKPVIININHPGTEVDS